MGVSQCMCPLCQGNANASDIDLGNRVRIYCSSCSATYDITKFAYEGLKDSNLDHRKALIAQAKQAPPREVLVISKDGAAYETKKSKADNPAPDWLGRPDGDA